MKEKNSISPHYKSAKKWLSRAAKDLRAAKAVFSPDLTDYYLASYLCQQCSEKSMKSFLALNRKRNIYEHPTSKLAGTLLKIDPGIEDILKETTKLDPYAVAVRYPDCEIVVTKETTEKAIHLAEKIFNYFLERAEKLAPDPQSSL